MYGPSDATLYDHMVFHPATAIQSCGTQDHQHHMSLQLCAGSSRNRPTHALSQFDSGACNDIK